MKTEDEIDFIKPDPRYRALDPGVVMRLMPGCSSTVAFGIDWHVLAPLDAMDGIPATAGFLAKLSKPTIKTIKKYLAIAEKFGLVASEQVKKKNGKTVKAWRLRVDLEKETGAYVEDLLQKARDFDETISRRDLKELVFDLLHYFDYDTMPLDVLEKVKPVAATMPELLDIRWRKQD